jgi:hypothetical protein
MIANFVMRDAIDFDHAAARQVIVAGSRVITSRGNPRL